MSAAHERRVRPLPPRHGAPWGLGRKLLLQVALLPLLLLAVEGAYRAWKPGTHDPAATAAELLQAAEAVETPLIAFNAGRTDGRKYRGLTPRRIPSPFWGWEYENQFEDLVEEAAYFTTPESEDAYDILILGGSVAMHFYLMGSERLAQRLAEDPRFAGREVRILSAARGGGKQPQQLNYLAYVLGLGWKPDAVISLDGFNEVAIGNQNAGLGAHPLHPSVPHWGHLLAFGRAGEQEVAAMWRLRDAKGGPRRVAEAFLRYGLQRSALLSDLARNRSRAARRRYVHAYSVYESALRDIGSSAGLFGPAAPLKFETTLELIAQAWMDASRNMQALCNEFGIHFVHALQPTLHDRGSKPLTPEELRTGTAGRPWIDGVVNGYPLLRAAGRQLREEGVNFVDGSMVFEHVADPLYYDACHFTQPGQELLADQVAAEFLAALPKE